MPGEKQAGLLVGLVAGADERLPEPGQRAVLAREVEPVPAEEELAAAAGPKDGVQLIGSGPINSRVWFQPAIVFSRIQSEICSFRRYSSVYRSAFKSPPRSTRIAAPCPRTAGTYRRTTTPRYVR